MASKDKSSRIAIGFRVKTGRATAVVMAGPASAPRVLSRKSVQLFDPAIPESHQPFHAELELPPADSARVVPIALKAVDRVALSALRELVGEVQPGLGSIVGIALVAGSATDPESIRNPHMRAHAREGQLFPRALASGRQRRCVSPRRRSSNPKSSPVLLRNLVRRPTLIKIAVAELGRSRRQAVERRRESRRGRRLDCPRRLSCPV